MQLPKNCTTRSRHWATVENVNNDHIVRTVNTAEPIPTQSAEAAPTHRRATVEDADDEDDSSAPNAATARPPTSNSTSALISDTTPPQHCQLQEDPVNEGGPMEGKSNSHILIFLWHLIVFLSGQSAVPTQPFVTNNLATTSLPSTTPVPQMPRNFHFSSPGEQFPSPSLSSSDGTPFTSPSQSPRYSRGTPRSGPHSPNRRCALHAPAGNKQQKHANDVRTFYSEEKELHICLFCTSVFLYHVPLIYFLWHVYREKHALNPQYMVTRYGNVKTSNDYGNRQQSKSRVR